MAVFNKILNILVLVLAICAVFFGFFLFQKRVELRRRGDTMAKMINRVAGILDTNSGTTIKDQLVITRLELDPEINPDLSKHLKISLYHNNYKSLNAVLKPFAEQATTVVTQRDILGETLNDVIVSLETPEPDTFSADQFQNVSTYKVKVTDLLAIIKKVNDRDNALVKQLVESAGVVDFTLEADALKNLDDFATPLSEFGTKISALKTRSSTYETHIASVCEILAVPAPSLEGEDYSDALSTASTAIQGFKDDFEACKRDLKLTKDKLAETEDKLNQEIEKVAKLEEENDKLRKRIADILGDEEDPNAPAGKQDNKVLVKKLEGNILKVNKKWDFVVIDLGKESKKNKMMRGIKNPKEINVSLPEGEVMDVSRNNKYLGQIKIIRVNDNCAIADILADNKQGVIEPGDRVFFARTPKVDEDEDDDDDDDE